MNQVKVKYLGNGLSLLVGIGVFLFWYVWYPHALSYQEQYQLFLWTGDYFMERVSVPGGFAEWLGEFIVQFYYVEWLGALLLALLFVGFGWLAGWIPAALLLWLLGDPSVLLGYAMAVMIAVGVNRMNRLSGRTGLLADMALVPLVYWLAGSLAWIYVVMRWLKLHKAVGWLLREAGKRNEKELVHYLDVHHLNMPRTMLRYAIEKMPEQERQYWMKVSTKATE